MRKKLLGLFLSMVMVLGLLPTTALAAGGISLSADSLDFGSVSEGYTINEGLNITITNHTGAEATLELSGAEHYSYSVASNTLANQGNTTLTVKPKGDLTEGTYNESMIVEAKGTKGTYTKEVTLQFTVTKDTSGGDTEPAEDGSKAIQLVDNKTAANISGGQESSVYFGKYQQSSDGSSNYNTDPIKWRVLSNAAGKLFLLSDQNLDVFEYHKEEEAVTWATSTMRSWLNGLAENQGDEDNAIDYTDDNFLDDAFSSQEQTAIANTINNTATDKIFLLSQDEAEKDDYGFGTDDDRVATNTAYVADGGKVNNEEDMSDVDESDYWWLRTPGSSDKEAMVVDDEGDVDTSGKKVSLDFFAVRPAMNLDLSSVLFTSAAEGGKPGDMYAPSGRLTAITENDSDEWKLTLKDASRKFDVKETTATGKAGDRILLTYAGAKVGANEYLSVILEDKDGNITHYGRVAEVALGCDSGTVGIVIPSVAEGTYTLHVFNEQYNGDKYTDYASEFEDVTLTVTGDTTPVEPPEVTVDNAGEAIKVDASGTYEITIDGAETVYAFEVAETKTIPLTGTDANKKAYDFMGKKISIVRKGDTTTADSAPVTVEVATRPAAPDSIAASDIARIGDQITVTAKAGYEYSIDGKTWVKDDDKDGKIVFDGLDTYKDYTISYRLCATDKSFASSAKTLTVAASCSTEKCSYYSDVKGNAWYHPSVDYVTQVGIMQGKGNQIFDPEVTLTRAEMAQILYNYQKNVVGKAEQGKTSIAFSDVKSGEWYEKAIQWASSNDIILGDGAGDNNTFRPDDAVSREEMVTMLYRYMVTFSKKLPLPASGAEEWKEFPDAKDVADWAETAFAWAVHYGVIEGDDGYLRPQNTATRAQAAKIVMVAVKQ